MRKSKKKSEEVFSSEYSLQSKLHTESVTRYARTDSAITLIALVITIIVLLILAGVSLSLIMGNDGILGRAENAVTEHTNASIEEEVELALAELKMEYYDEKYVKGTPELGEYTDYASKKLTEGINTSNGTLVLALDGTSLSYKNSDNVELAKGEFNAETGGVTIAGVATGGAGNSNTIPDGMYSVAGIAADDIADEALFNVEPLATSNGEKEAKITLKNNVATPTADNYYDIGIDEDTFIVPYEVQYNEETYKVVETDFHLAAQGYDFISNLPGVKELIYPNTVRKIIARSSPYDVPDEVVGKFPLETVVLSNKLEEIPTGLFYDAKKLKNITIPNSVTSIGQEAFMRCTGLTSVTIGNSVTSIGEGAFDSCSALTSIELPRSVTSIKGWAFANCSGLTKVYIPKEVTTISASYNGANTFGYCSSTCKIYTDASAKQSGWEKYWNYYDSSNQLTVYYNTSLDGFRDAQ